MQSIIVPGTGAYTKVLVSGKYRFLPTALWDGLEGPKPENPAAFVCNGCTMSPDQLRGKEIWPACVIHDFQYGVESYVDRKDADAAFRRNISFLMKAQGVFAPLAWLISFTYWRAVRRAGRRFYSGSGDAS